MVSFQRLEGEDRSHWKWSCTADSGAWPSLFVSLELLESSCRRKLGFLGWNMLLDFLPSVLERMTLFLCLLTKVKNPKNRQLQFCTNYIRQHFSTLAFFMLKISLDTFTLNCYKSSFQVRY